MKHIKNILIILLSSFLITALLKVFIIQFYINESDSMFKTIEQGSKLIVSKISKLRKNDIVLYKDHNDQLCVSRLAATENDSVTISGQNVMINSQVVKSKLQVLSYYFRFISEIEAEFLQNISKPEEEGNSGIYSIQLTDFEYNFIKNDSLSNLSLKLFPFESLIRDIFSESIQNDFLIVKKDYVFLLNDNRSNAHDSRTFGLIPKENLIGKVILSF